MKLRFFAKPVDQSGEAYEIFRLAKRFGGCVHEFDGMKDGNGFGTVVALVSVPDEHVDAFTAHWESKFPNTRPSVHEHDSKAAEPRSHLATHRIVAFGVGDNDFSHKVLRMLSRYDLNLASIWHKQFVDPYGPLSEAQKFVAYTDLTVQQVDRLKRRFASVFDVDSSHHVFRVQHMHELTSDALQFTPLIAMDAELPHDVERRSFIIPTWNQPGLALAVDDIAHTEHCHVDQMDGMRRHHGTATIIVTLSGHPHHLNTFFERVQMLNTGAAAVTPYHAEHVESHQRTEDASHLLTVKGGDCDILRQTLHHVAHDLSLDISRLWFATNGCGAHDGVVQAFFDNFDVDAGRFHRLVHSVADWAKSHGFSAHFCSVKTRNGDEGGQSLRPPWHRDAA